MSVESPVVPAPYPLAMIVCDAIWKDPGTSKSFLLGCFSTIMAREFPATHPILSVYVCLTDGYGKVPFRFRIVDSEEPREPLFTAEGELEFTDARAVLEIALTAQNLIFPEGGEYRCQLFANKEFVLERRILVQGAMETLP